MANNNNNNKNILLPVIHGYCSAVVTKHDTGEKIQLSLWKHNVFTNTGRDAFHDLVYVNDSADTPTTGFNWIAATESTISPDSSNTDLAGEINANGISRLVATTHSHTVGTNSSTVEHTYTITGAGFTSVKASALFRQSSGGTMAHIANFGTASGTLAANDTLKITWTLQLQSA